MGYVTLTSPCVACHQLMTYNPIAVPSITINGSREPVCRDCIARVNPRRIANGLPPIVPRPDAYEPVDESLVPWPED